MSNPEATFNDGDPGLALSLGSLGIDVIFEYALSFLTKCLPAVLLSKVALSLGVLLEMAALEDAFEAHLLKFASPDHQCLQIDEVVVYLLFVDGDCIS